MHALFLLDIQLDFRVMADFRKGKPDRNHKIGAQTQLNAWGRGGGESAQCKTVITRITHKISET